MGIWDFLTGADKIGEGEKKAAEGFQNALNQVQQGNKEAREYLQPYMQGGLNDYRSLRDLITSGYFETPYQGSYTPPQFQAQQFQPSFNPNTMSFGSPYQGYNMQAPQTYQMPSLPQMNMDFGGFPQMPQQAQGGGAQGGGQPKSRYPFLDYGSGSGIDQANPFQTTPWQVNIPGNAPGMPNHVPVVPGANPQPLNRPDQMPSFNPNQTEAPKTIWDYIESFRGGRGSGQTVPTRNPRGTMPQFQGGQPMIPTLSMLTGGR